MQLDFLLSQENAGLLDPVYNHKQICELLVQEGDQVTQGQTIALVGSTGRSTGPHCHFELLWQDELLEPQLCLP